MQTIHTRDDIEAGLAALCRVDPRLERVRSTAGQVPLRRTPPGFASLSSIIISQQVSRASADAIHGRLAQLVDPLTPAGVLAATDSVFREAGLSRPKQRTLIATAEAVEAGRLDLDRLDSDDPDGAVAVLTAITGIGPWTARCYLLFAAGHPDLFPADDLALQAAVAHAFGMERRPASRELERIAETWSPWRSVAARLFWAYYGEIRGREAAPTG